MDVPSYRALSHKVVYAMWAVRYSRRQPHCDVELQLLAEDGSDFRRDSSGELALRCLGLVMGDTVREIDIANNDWYLTDDVEYVVNMVT